MKKASITEAKNQLSALVDQVKRGATIVIMDRERPVAKLVPAHREATEDTHLSHLVRAGLIALGKGTAARVILDESPVEPTRAVNVVQQIIDDRDDRV